MSVLPEISKLGQREGMVVVLVRGKNMYQDVTEKNSDERAERVQEWTLRKVDNHQIRLKR